MTKEVAPVKAEVTTSKVEKEEETVKIEVNPDDYVCFGTMDTESSECQSCKFHKQCVEKTAENK